MVEKQHKPLNIVMLTILLVSHKTLYWTPTIRLDHQRLLTLYKQTVISQFCPLLFELRQQNEHFKNDFLMFNVNVLMLSSANESPFITFTAEIRILSKRKNADCSYH